MVQLIQLAHTLAAAEEPAGISALGIDPLAILAQAVTFLVLLFVIQKFALKKIVSTLEERRKTINRGLHLTAEMDKLKAEFDETTAKALKEARKEADTIINEARVESGEIIKASEEAAGRKADAILREAEAKIERDIVAAKKDLKTEMAGLVVEVTSAVLRTKVTDSSDRKLVEQYLKEVL